MKNKRDVFDRLFELKPLRGLASHREGILYLFFGGLTTLVNLVCSAFFWYVIGWNDVYMDLFGSQVAVGTFFGNLISIVISIIFAYVTNRIWVFRSEVTGVKGIGAEFGKFFGARVVTLLIELGGVQLVTVLFPGDGVVLFIGKLITQVLVIILNFVFSKLIVFK
ncbi:MAG: GtrA family protein [Eubacterium sp.]|nr:GtrA family protein [Eubacterium sp.]